MKGETRRFTRRELYERVWKTPVETLAKELGMSGRGLAKLCERHGVPVPPRDYWARKAARPAGQAAAPGRAGGYSTSGGPDRPHAAQANR